MQNGDIVLLANWVPHPHFDQLLLFRELAVSFLLFPHFACSLSHKWTVWGFFIQNGEMQLGKSVCFCQRFLSQFRDVQYMDLSPFYSVAMQDVFPILLAQSLGNVPLLLCCRMGSPPYCSAAEWGVPHIAVSQNGELPILQCCRLARFLPMDFIHFRSIYILLIHQCMVHINKIIQYSILYNINHNNLMRRQEET